MLFSLRVFLFGGMVLVSHRVKVKVTGSGIHIF